MKLSNRETAIILAALRIVQYPQYIDPLNGLLNNMEQMIEEKPTDAHEIDELCEKLNCEPDKSALSLVDRVFLSNINSIQNNEEDAKQFGARLAEVFRLRRSRKHKNLFVLSEDYFTKSTAGVARVILRLLKEHKRKSK